MRRFPVKRAAMAAFAALGLSACASPLSTPPPPVSVPPASAVALAGDETAVGERSDPTAVAPTPVEPATAADTATESAAAEVTAESAAPELTQPAAPSTAPASSPVAPAAVAPTTIDQQALDLIAAMKREVAVQATRQAADAANSAAGTLVEASRARVERAEAARPVLDATRVAALDVRDTVRAEVHHLKDRLADGVGESFQLSHTAGDASSRDLGGMLGDGGSFADYSAGSAYGEVALRTVQDQLSASRARLADAESALAAASDALADNEVELNESRSGLESAQSEATKVAADGEAAVQRASVTGDSAPVGLEGPTIMGPSVVSAADMAAFVQAKGNSHPSLDVTELARTFLDEGKPMLTLLAAIQPRLSPKLQAYVRLLLQASGQPAPEPTLPAPAVYPTPATHSEELFERLSERELEVLRLVDEGLSDSQIAGKLILAVGTVKRHLNNIYGKLGVHNRTHALARARILKLL